MIFSWHNTLPTSSANRTLFFFLPNLIKERFSEGCSSSSEVGIGEFTAMGSAEHSFSSFCSSSSLSSSSVVPASKIKVFAGSSGKSTDSLDSTVVVSSETSGITSTIVSRSKVSFTVGSEYIEPKRVAEHCHLESHLRSIQGNVQ
ncbi:hypothetical protein ACTXT7_000017 [Hymenolepis weldensis]